MFAVNKQEFFELVDRQESQLAFALLNRRLKPLEAQCTVAGDDFKDLAYLTTCRSIRDAPAFREWPGVATSRAKLEQDLKSMMLNELLCEMDEEGDVLDDVQGRFGCFSFFASFFGQTAPSKPQANIECKNQTNSFTLAIPKLKKRIG